MAKAPVTTGKEIANYNEQLAKLAAQQAETEKNVGGGSNFSIKGGKLTLAGNEIPDNRMGVICLDAIMVNTLYTADFSDQDKTPPECYAFGYDDESMTPHDEVEKPRSKDCKSCEFNQWGSAERGRGKACQNRRKIACIPAGIYNKDGKFEAFTESDDFETSKISILTIPPTSLTSWATYVKALASTKVPTLGVITRVEVAMQGTYPVVNFSAITRLPMGVIPVVMRRYEEAHKQMITPFPKAQEKVESKPKKRKY